MAQDEALEFIANNKQLFDSINLTVEEMLEPSKFRLRMFKRLELELKHIRDEYLGEE